ncbi:MAG: hypothetical protein U1E76_11730 [Planctomycetota bacterium]
MPIAATWQATRRAANEITRGRATAARAAGIESATATSTLQASTGAPWPATGAPRSRSSTTAQTMPVSTATVMTFELWVARGIAGGWF